MAAMSSKYSFLFLLVALCSAQVACSRGASKKPNIILFVIDDLGWNDTGYQGAAYATPTIDRLAAEGIRLDQYYVQPMCSPSRAALLSGRYPYNLGLAHGTITVGVPHGLGLDQITLAQQLMKGGYGTHAVGKWDLGMHKWEYTPTYRGFDTFNGFYGAAEDYFTHDVACLNLTTLQTISTIGVDFRHNKDPVTTDNGVYSTHIFTKAIQDSIRSHRIDDRPFFVYGAYQAVHGPAEVPDEYLKGECSSINYDTRKTFCGMMQALDEGIENITTLLETTGFLDDTIIILTTDNGGQTHLGSVNYPLRGNKMTLFEGGVRGVAFVWGKMLANTNYDYGGLMHITDWYKTIVEGIAGLEISEDVTKNLDGYNMWQALTHNEPSPRCEILLQLDPPRESDIIHAPTYYQGEAALRSGDWKLILGIPSNCPPLHREVCPTGWMHPDGSIEEPPKNPSQTWLFNVGADPNERYNMAEIFPDIVSRLKERIEEFNATHILQKSLIFDSSSDPSNFGGVWTPWK